VPLFTTLGFDTLLAVVAGNDVCHCNLAPVGKLVAVINVKSEVKAGQIFVISFPPDKIGFELALLHLSGHV
jgi:hypothetical protein